MLELFNLAGKTAIVTGAGRGIGRGIAIGLAGAGANLVLVSRTEEQLRLVESEIKDKYDVGTMIFACDVTKRDAVDEVIEKTVLNFGRLDILVNNAGINYKKNFIDVTEEDWKEIINVNLTGQFQFAHAAARQMASQGGGKIINMASVGGFIGLVNTAPYCASKGGILQMTKVMAADLADKNILVNAICPGYIDTGLLKDPAQKQVMMDRMKNGVPLKRPGRPEDLAGAAIFLASDASNYVTGSYITIDGGMSCKTL